MASFPPIDRDRYSLLPGCQARCQVKVPGSGRFLLYRVPVPGTVLYPVSLAVSVSTGSEESLPGRTSTLALPVATSSLARVLPVARSTTVPGPGRVALYSSTTVALAIPVASKP